MSGVAGATCDVAVAGGGLAGAAAAWRLARAGARVALFERERAPHDKVCGEFVSVEAGEHLGALAGGVPAGSLLPALGAVPIDRVRLVAGRIEAAAALPFRAWGLSRRRLDAWALREAGRAGASVHPGRAVRLDGGDAPVLRTGDGPVPAGAVLLATGKHELRGHKRRARASDAVGLKMHLRLAPDQERALDGHVELVLLDGGYAGLQRVEGGLANLCLVVSKARLAREGRDWHRLALSVPHLRRRLEGAAPCWPRPLAISGVPYGYLHRGDDALDPPGVYRVGDQLAVIPSFTGDGMAMALHTAGLAAAAALAGRPAAAFHRDAARAFRPSLRLAGLAAAAGAHPRAHPAVAALCSAFPGLLTGLAARTRIRDPRTTTPPCPTPA